MRKKIIVKAPALSNSGYGEQARFALRSLREHEDKFDIYFINIPWGRTGNAILQETESAWINSLILKTQNAARANNNMLHFDLSLQVTIPNEFEKMADVNIGYTAGIETTKVSPQWLEKSNLMDKIIVPSKHSASVFKNTVYKTDNGELKLTTPVEVCAFPALERETSTLDLKLETDWNFLSVAQWGPRKNVEATIENFLAEFKDEPDVGLVLKLNIAKNSIMDKLATEARLQKLLNQATAKHGDVKCRVYLLHGNLTETEMFALYRHPKIKAFVTTTHGEGFGLPLFEAAIAGLPIAAPAWSSYLDFLYAPKKDKKTGKIKNKPHFVKIPYELRPVQKEAVWDGVIQADSQWCWVTNIGTRSALRDLKKNHGIFLSDAKKLSSYILEKYKKENQMKSFTQNLKSFLSEDKSINFEELL